MIACGKYPAFTCMIMPFSDRLDVQIPWLFYAVSNNVPSGPATVFTDRFFDDRENWIPPGVGVVPHSLRPYFGPIPPLNTPLTPVVGSPDEWLHGLNYDAWVAGAYNSTPCVPLAFMLLQENSYLLRQEDNSDIEI